MFLRNTLPANLELLCVSALLDRLLIQSPVCQTADGSFYPERLQSFSPEAHTHRPGYITALCLSKPVVVF